MPMRLRQATWIIIAVSVLLKFWLVAAQPVVAHANASFDDRLFLALAEPILKGHWLGPYSQFTLMKGPMYSLFIAAAYLARVPLPIAQHLLYLAGCALLVLALRPCFGAAWQAVALFNFLWWQPMSYVELDVLRQNIYTPLTLLFFAGLCALQTQHAATFGRRVLWGMLLGITAGAFYLTREEGVWILPGATLLIVWAFWTSWGEASAVRSLMIALLAATVCSVAIVGTVCTLNYRYYGWFGTVEFRAPEFRAAYGALQRPISAEEIPYVPVPRDVRRKLYEVSPSFAELQPCLEGSVGLEWASYSDYLTGRPGEELQIGGGSFMWALRDCVIASGHSENAKAALNFYRSMATEINRACDDGRIAPVRSRRDSLVPRRHRGDLQRLIGKAPEYAADFLLFRGFTAYPTESWGDADLLALFQNLTRWRLSHSNEAPELDPQPSVLNDGRLATLEFIGNVFRWLGVLLVITGIGAWIFGVRNLVRSRWNYLFGVATAALGSALVVLLLNLTVDALAFRNRGPTALHEGYPLLILFAVTAWANALAFRGATNADRP